MEGSKAQGAKVLCSAPATRIPLAFYPRASTRLSTSRLIQQPEAPDITHENVAAKIDSAEKLTALNPASASTTCYHAEALQIIRDRHVADARHFPALSSTSLRATGKPNATAPIFRFEGQASVFATSRSRYRCLYPNRRRRASSLLRGSGVLASCRPRRHHPATDDQVILAKASRSSRCSWSMRSTCASAS